jgi:tetratricopeptide (TPR) repeat protein
MCPLVVFVGFVVQQWPRRAPRQVSWITVLMAVIPLGYWTFERNRVWGNPVAFWEDNVAKSPNKPRTHFQLARAYMAQQAWDDAETHLESAIQLDSDYYDARTTLANIYIEQQVRPERSEELLMRILDEKPDDVFALVGMGVLHSRRGDLEESIVTFRHILELEPDNLAALVNSATIHSEQKDYEEAVRVARIGTGYWPANARLVALLGAASAELRQTESAAEALGRALELDPGNPLASRYLERR